MCPTTVTELFTTELKHIYYAEQQLVPTLADLENQSATEAIRTVFSDHRSETQGHVDRLEEVFDRLSESDDSGLVEQIEEFVDPSGNAADVETDHMIDGLLTDHEAFVSANPEPQVLDRYTLIVGQKAQHYEIATYGNLIPLAAQLGVDEVATTLEAILREEQAALDELSTLSEDFDDDQLSA
jgi:ferritin-like metal-binding protein YciE